ncbi:pyruvate formate-lyase activating enzyme [Coriobacterium glomerans PW2]|uniref:Pyruvate formate-lyase-activating enzyme n=1 Tax=Coriobacterium glomerans (strain ATCC 49209 / DSM 20642 / JCM 10262 / PW2) TaxID=700015 RepID=F2NAZ6_CORGP|nr:pyruvate formate-lyase-activating protein [Coriobacterium glomerans]AEB07674.1 pyruvate formate-lyase activating enzyme [Coriobacterium glomerans PW2]
MSMEARELSGSDRPSAFARGSIHSIETMGTVDGPGIRFVVFCQGCPMRCAYCHNPDTWRVDSGASVTVEHLVEEFESNRSFYKTGGITVSGGEPLLQPDFVGDLFGAMHDSPSGRVHTCLDSCGYAYDPRRPDRFEHLFDECDLVLLDIKHADPEEHRSLCGCDMDSILAFGEELSRRKIATVIRHVIVPGLTDTVEECTRVGRLIASWRNVVGLELLAYHTLGVSKYEQLGIPYRLAGVPQMDSRHLPELRRAVLRGMKEGRAG